MTSEATPEGIPLHSAPSETWMAARNYATGQLMRVRVARYGPRVIQVEHAGNGARPVTEQRTYMEALLAGETPGQPTAYVAAWAGAPDFTSWRIAYQYRDDEPLPGNWDVNKVRPGTLLWKRYLPLVEEHARKTSAGSSGDGRLPITVRFDRLRRFEWTGPAGSPAICGFREPQALQPGHVIRPQSLPAALAMNRNSGLPRTGQGGVLG